MTTSTRSERPGTGRERSLAVKRPKYLLPLRRVRLAEAKSRSEAAEYRVLYPSGRDFKVTGVFGQAMKGRELLGPTIRTADGKVTVLDPRGLVIRGDLVVYSPRAVIASPAEIPLVLTAEMREWMRAHPEWPPIEWFKEGS